MPIDLDEYREQSRESWARMASGWEKRREWVMEQTGLVSDWLLEKLDPSARPDGPRAGGRHG